MLNERRRETRWLGFQVIRGWADPEKLPSIEEIWHIDGDPTPEEKEAALEQQKIADKKWANDLVAKMLEKGTLKRKANWKKDSK